MLIVSKWLMVQKLLENCLWLSLFMKTTSNLYENNSTNVETDEQ